MRCLDKESQDPNQRSSHQTHGVGLSRSSIVIVRRTSSPSFGSGRGRSSLRSWRRSTSGTGRRGGGSLFFFFFVVLLVVHIVVHVLGTAFLLGLFLASPLGFEGPAAVTDALGLVRLADEKGDGADVFGRVGDAAIPADAGETQIALRTKSRSC